MTPWTVAHQAPLSMRFSRQEYWSGLPCPPPRDLSHSGIEPETLMSPVLTGRFFTTSITWASLEGLFRITENPHQPSPTENHDLLLPFVPRCFFFFFFKSYWCSMVKQENMKRNPGLCSQVELDGTPAQPPTNFGVP